MAEELKAWLERAGLGGYAEAFAANDIDWEVLGDLTDPDLQELGLSLGDRKRLQKALAALGHGAPVAKPPKPRRLKPKPAPPAAAASVEAERRQLSVMFVDLIDSTPLAERLDPEEMRRILGVFHQACASAIEAHGGHIAQYLGDGLLVYFGYPLAHEDDASRAVCAGLDLIANLGTANDQLEAESQVRLAVRVAVETGIVVAGEVGAGAALDRRAVVGEAPIVAARLQALAPADSIVIGPATERLIQGSFVLESLGEHVLKGITGALAVYRVVARSHAVDSFDIRAVRGLTPLVGRNAELELLRQRWNQSCDGEMRCVLLVGEPGIGKSRTLRAFRDSLEDADHQTISFHCSSYYRDSPFWPVLQLLQRSFGLDPTAVADADAGRFEDALAAFTTDVGETALALWNLLEMPATGHYPKVDTSQTSFKRRCLNVLVDLVEGMSRHQPVLLVVEDAHWIDPSTLELVRSLLERLTASRLLLLITARPDFKPDWHYPHLVQLNLDRLSRRDRFAMIERLTGGKPIPEVVLDQIVAKTDGVPLFVEELTKAILQGDMLHDTGERYELSGPLLAIAIPDTLQGSLLSRLDRLEPDVKEIAQIASTIGREFQKDLLARIAPKPDAALGRALVRLVAADIILPARSAPEGGAFLFRHALIQDIAYQSMLVTRRRHFHGQIAECLERHYPDVVERQPELIAQNLASSDHPERAIDYWRQAGERALARAAFKEAIAHAEAGLRLAESLSSGDMDRALQTIPLLLIRGHAEFRLGDRKAIGAYQRAAQMAQAHKLPSFLAQAALGAEEAGNYIVGSGGAAATALLEAALAAIGPEDSVERCRLLSRLANSLYIIGSFKRAAEVADEALVLARRMNDDTSLLFVLVCELMHVGANPLPIEQFPNRRRLLEELEQISIRGGADGVDRITDERAQQVAGARAASAYLEIGDYARFEATRQKHNRDIMRGPELVQTWIALCFDVVAAILVGDFALAERKADQSMRLAEGVDADLPSGVYGMQMFTIRREQGRLAEVASVIKRLVDENPEDSTWRPGLMLIASDLGFEGPALINLERLAETGFAVPADSKRLVTWTYIAEVAARLKKDPYTEQVYKQLLPFRDQAVTVPAATLCLGSTARYLGLLATALGDWSAAEAHFEYALDMNERMHAWPWLAHTRHEFALMLSARNRKGDRRRAADLLANASATARELNMFALVERIGGVTTRSVVSG